MVGQGHGRRSVLGRAAAEVVDAAGAVQEGVLGMDVEMYELRQLTMPGLKKTKLLDVTLHDGRQPVRRPA